jgi:hypothetical protein
MPIFLSTSKTIAVATVALATLLGTGRTALAIPTATPNGTLSTRQTGYAINLGTVENAGLYAWVAGENRCTGERNFVAPARLPAPDILAFHYCNVSDIFSRPVRTRATGPSRWASATL